MQYKILKIVQVSKNHYDVDYEEITLFRKALIFKNVRTNMACVLGTIVSTNEYLHNFREIIAAYDCSSIDFTQREEPLPRVHTSSGKAIY